jgi:diaminopimelate epimerase
MEEPTSGRKPFRSMFPAAQAIDWPLQLNGQHLRINAVLLGNPHFVVSVDKVSSEQARVLNWHILTRGHVDRRRSYVAQDRLSY